MTPQEKRLETYRINKAKRDAQDQRVREEKAEMREALRRVVRDETASPEQILQATELLVKIGLC